MKLKLVLDKLIEIQHKNILEVYKTDFHVPNKVFLIQEPINRKGELIYSMMVLGAPISKITSDLKSAIIPVIGKLLKEKRGGVLNYVVGWQKLIQKNIGTVENPNFVKGLLFVFETIYGTESFCHEIELEKVIDEEGNLITKANFKGRLQLETDFHLFEDLLDKKPFSEEIINFEKLL